MKRIFLFLPLIVLVFSCDKTESDDTNDTLQLDVPTLQTPVNGADLQATTFDFNFSWSAVGNAESYELEIADNTNFTNAENIIASSNNVDVTSSDIQAGNTYYWRVRATATDFITSDYSQVFSFHYSDGSGSTTQVPTLLTPADNSTVTTSKPTLTWSNTPLSGSSYYIVQFASDFAFNVVFYTGQSVNTSFTIPQAIDPLAPYATVFWRVSADGGTTYSDYFTLNIQ